MRFLAVSLIGLGFVSGLPALRAEYPLIQLTGPDIYSDRSPEVSGSHVAWRRIEQYQGWDIDYEIFRYDISTGSTTQLTDNNYQDGAPQLSGSDVAWGYGRSIYYYDGTTTTQLTANCDSDFQLSGSTVAWRNWDGNDYEVFVHDLRTDITTQLTDNDYNDGWQYDPAPQVSDSTVAWRNWDGNDNEISVHDLGTGTTTQVTDNNYDDSVPRVSGSNVVWSGGEEIFLYDGTTTTQLTDDSYRDGSAHVSGSNVFWPSLRNDWEIFHYDISAATTTQLTSNPYNDTIKDVYGPLVVGLMHDGNDYEIFVYDIRTDIYTQLTDNDRDDTGVHVSGSDSGYNVVWEYFAWQQGHGWPNRYQAFLALFPGLTLTSIATGNWEDASTWDDGTRVPTDSIDTVVGGHTVTVAVDGAAKSLLINNSGEVLIGAGNTLTVVNDVVVASTATLNVAGTLDANLLATTGQVHLSPSANLNVPTVDVSGGTLSTSASIAAEKVNVIGGVIQLLNSANLNVATMKALGGTVDTGGSRVIVGESLKLGRTTFSLAQPPKADPVSFSASGSDLLAGADITLEGGTVTVSAPAVLDILFVVFLDSLVKGGDQGVYDYLTNDLDHNVTAVTGMAAQPTHATGMDLVIVSGTNFPHRVGTKFTDQNATFHAMGIPTINYNPGLVDDAQLGSDVHETLENRDTLRILAPEHPMAAGFTGDVQVRNSKLYGFSSMSYHPGESIPVQGTIVAGDLLWQVDDGPIEHPTIFALDQGELLLEGTPASANRIFFFFDQWALTDATGDAYALFEAAVNYAVGDTKGPLDMPTYDFAATASSTLECDSPFDAVIGNVTLDPGVTLTFTGAPSVSFADVTAGDGASIDATAVLVRGTLSPGSSLGTVTIDGHLDVGPDATYLAELGGADADLVAVTGNVALSAGSTLMLDAISSLAAVGDAAHTILSAASVYGTFTHQPDVDDHLGYGVFHRGVAYGADAVDVTVFQAKAGDTDGNRDVSFGDFNALANNYTGSLDPGTGGKDWPQGDFDGDEDVDFGDFNNLANNYTGTENWYANKAATGGRAIGEDAPGGEAPLEDAKAQLIVDLGDGSVVMAGGPVELNGYSVTSASGSLLPDEFPMPLPLHFYISNTTDEITAGVIGMKVVLDGALQMPWGFDSGGLKREGDLVFSYGTSAGTFQGNVIYDVPEPAAFVLLAAAAIVLLLWQRQRPARTARSCTQAGSAVCTRD